LRLPLDPARLRERFPSLTGEDLAAYSELTRALLTSPRTRLRRLAEILCAAQRGRERAAAEAPLDGDECLALAYFRALEKMQGR
jgi:hypothetical protein